MVWVGGYTRDKRGRKIRTRGPRVEHEGILAGIVEREAKEMAFAFRANPEQRMILDAMGIIGKSVPMWLEPVFDTENRLLKRIDFPRAYDFTTERRQWHIAELPAEMQKLVYDEASKLPASSIEHLDIIVEEGMLV